MNNKEQSPYTQDLSIEKMHKACIHYGHKKRFCHPDMMPYISSIKNDMTFIDLQQSLHMMKTACEALGKTVENGGSVLFVGTKFLKKYKNLDLIKDFANRCEAYYVNKRWLGGTLTNLSSIRVSCEELEHIQYQVDHGVLPKLKKQQVLQKKRLEGLKMRVGGIVNMTKIPSILIVFDCKYEDVAVQDAHNMGIPVIGIVDTNNSLKNITYPIPSNDDAISCLEFHLSAFTNIINLAKDRREKQHKKELVQETQKLQDNQAEEEGDFDPEKDISESQDKI